MSARPNLTASARAAMAAPASGAETRRERPILRLRFQPQDGPAAPAARDGAAAGIARRARRRGDAAQGRVSG